MTLRFSNIAFVLALVTASAASAAADDPARTIAIGAATQLEQRYVYPMKAKAAAAYFARAPRRALTTVRRVKRSLRR